uniref:Uncharacterized protein n=1 Tax=Romanomermis culicivorax TaxID=13658 RepID=A0A915I8T0_ROMCU
MQAKARKLAILEKNAKICIFLGKYWRNMFFKINIRDSKFMLGGGAENLEFQTPNERSSVTLEWRMLLKYNFKGLVDTWV